MRARSIFEAVGASLLILLPQLLPFITPGHLILFHHNLPLRHVVGGLAIDLILVFLILVACGWGLKKLPPSSHDALLTAGFGFLIWWTLIKGLPTLVGTSALNGLVQVQQATRFTSFVAFCQGHRLLLGVIIGFFYLVLPWTGSKIAQIILLTTRFGIACCACCSLWIIPELAILAIKYPSTPNFDHASFQAAPKPQQRIVWILFDELSYNLTFDHPPAGQEFSNFQKLEAESVSLSDVQPVGMYTDRIIPSVLIGNRFDRIRSTVDGQFLYLDPASERWLAYDPQKTLFGLAQRQGWNPAIAGWYNPYCRIFASVLSKCSWEPFENDGYLQEGPQEPSILSSALALPEHYLSVVLGQSSAGTVPEDLQHKILNYQAIMDNSAALIEDGSLRFVFIHLPVPHPPGIFDRKTHQFRNGGNYLDNLTLADDAMGQLLQEIDKSPFASETTVIVSSDHSWRLPLWSIGVDWTAEEQRVSGGVFDTRPVFLVHYPGQTSGTNITAPVSELVEHDIIAEMLNSKLQSPVALTQSISTAGN